MSSHSGQPAFGLGIAGAFPHRFKVYVAILITIGAVVGSSTGQTNLQTSSPVFPARFPQFSLAIDPPRAILHTGDTQKFTVEDRGPAKAKVEWLVGGIVGGNSELGIITAEGVYTAPNKVPPVIRVVVTARSLADPSRSVSATIRVISTPSRVAVSISPARVSLQSRESVQFIVVARGFMDPRVEWSAGGIIGGNAQVGTITPEGLYTAPSQAPPTGRVVVTANFLAEPARSASATVQVIGRPSPITLSISPSQVSLQAGAEQQFSAAVSGLIAPVVRWSVGGIVGGNAQLGTITSRGLYLAPVNVPPAGHVAVTASVLAGGLESASATVQITSPPPLITVSISPAQVSLQAGQSALFTGSVHGTTHGGLTWAVNGVDGGDAHTGTITAAGVYTAPGSVAGNSTISITARSSYDSSIYATATALVVETPPQTWDYSWARTIASGSGDFAYAADPASGAPNWGGPVGVGSVRHDPLYNNGEIFRCTDANTDPSNINNGYAVGIGGDASRVSWNTDDTLLDINVFGGNTAIAQVDTVHDTCNMICANGAVGGCTTTNPLATVGSGFFSKVNPRVFYSWTWDGALSPRIYKVELASGSSPSATLLVDFSPALYKEIQPNWIASASVSLGQVIEPTVNNGSPVDGHYPKFQAITNGTTGSRNPNFSLALAPVRSSTHHALPQPDYVQGSIAAGSVIFPLNGNTGLNMFYSTGTGTTSGLQPNWDSSCAALWSTCTDGGVTWMNIGRTSTIQDGSVLWVKLGFTETETTQQPVGVENQDDSFAKGLSYNGIQDTGTWALVYKISTQTIYQYNTYTQVETDFACTDSNGSLCPSPNATWTPTVIGMGGSGLSVTIHEIDLSQDGNTLNIGDYICQYATPLDKPCGPGGQNLLWTVGSATTVTPTVDFLGHGAIGATHIMNDTTSGGGPYYGWYEDGRTFTDYNSPYAMIGYASCVATGQSPSLNEPYCYPHFGAHWSWVHNLGQDQEPIVGTTYDLGQFPASSIFQNEIVGFTTCGQTGEPSCPSGYPSNQEYRFGRTFAYQTDHNNFNSWAAIGALSQTGKYFALTTTGFCTLGDTAGGNSPRCGWNWTPSYTYSAGKVIVPDWDPVNGTYVNLGSYAFRASNSGISGTASAMPAWCQTVGCTVTDNSVTWTNIGVTNGRSDILIYRIGQ